MWLSSELACVPWGGGVLVRVGDAEALRVSGVRGGELRHAATGPSVSSTGRGVGCAHECTAGRAIGARAIVFPLRPRHAGFDDLHNRPAERLADLDLEALSQLVQIVGVPFHIGQALLVNGCLAETERTQRYYGHTSTARKMAF